MKKVSHFILIFSIFFSMSFVASIGAKAASQYSGGLLDGEQVQIGKNIGQSSNEVSQLTDGNISTFVDLTSGNIAWYSFSSPAEISAVVAKFSGNISVEFYDESSNLIGKYQLLSNDGIQTLPTPVEDVSTVVLKYTGSSPRIYEWNVFTTPSVPPVPTTINWIQNGDKVVKLEWDLKGAKSYNVKRAPSSGGPYTLLENVTGTAYTDTTVTNGTTYYYVVSSVNQAGESVNSTERGITPNASQYTGGLLDWRTLQVSKSITIPGSTTRNLTDNNTGTFIDLYNGDSVWYTFSSPVELSAVVAKFSGNISVEFYDANSSLLRRYQLISNDGIQTLPATVKDVSTVVLKYTGSSPRIYEWNVFTSPTATSVPTAINWIQSGDKVVKLEWELKGAESYNVKRATSPGGPYILLGNIKGTTYTDTAVTNGTTYYYVVSSVNQAGESVNSAERGITPNASQYTGGLLDWRSLQVSKSITIPGSTTRNLTDNNTGTFIDLYNGDSVWYTFSSPVELSAIVAKFSGNISVEFYDASSNLLRKYQLISNDGMQTLPATVKDVSTVVLKYTGSSPRIYEWNVFTSPTVAPLSTAINWIQSGDKVVKLEWELKGAESYNVKRATSPGGPYILLGNIKGRTYTDTAVNNGTAYYYVISSVNQAGESINSAERGITPNATQYTGGLLDWHTLQVSKSITIPGSTTRNLTDNNTGTFIDLYNGDSVWYIFSSPVEISAVISKFSGNISAEFYDASNNLLGKHQLKNDAIQTLSEPILGVSTVALKYTGSSPRIYEWNVFGKIGELPLEAPVNLTAISGNKNVVLNWSHSGSTDVSYNIKRATVSGGPYTAIGSVTDDNLSYTDYNVINDITYYYVVTSVTDKGESDKSNEVSALPKSGGVDPHDPEAPVNLTAIGGNKNVVLNWNKPEGTVASYNVKRATISGGPYTTIESVTGETNNYTDNNVMNDTTYYYVVTAVTDVGESSSSNEASATPKSGEVTPPDPTEEGERALLRLILLNGVEKEYDLSMVEVTAFINWYEGRANGSGTVMYAIDKHSNNKGPFANRKDYVFFDKIITFEVNAYNLGATNHAIQSVAEFT